MWGGGPGLGTAPSALSKDVCALGERGEGDGGQDGSSEQAHPQETTLLRSLLSWFRILQTKLPLGRDSSYALSVYVTNLTRKSDLRSSWRSEEKLCK